jgi:hypothetical protein
MTIELQLNCTGGWVDYTKWVNITRLIRELSLNTDNDPQKEQTGTIELFGDAYTFVEANLISGANMYSNSMCVRITDNVCSGEVYLFKIDNKNLKWCDDSGCIMEFEMQAYQPELDCIRNTTIADNTNNVFDQFGAIVHPRFRYCDVFKPTLIFEFVLSLANIVDLIITPLNLVINIINAIFGASIPNIGTFAGSVSGCLRAWPSPFISTYITNVCTLCGLASDITTNPIFHDTQNPLNPSLPNPYYYATYLTSFTKQGVPVNGTQSYIPNNQPSQTLTAFLSQIKEVWNARWFIHNNKVFFHRKDLIGDLIWGTTPVLDFTGDDAKKLIQGVCFTWNGEGKIKRIYMAYEKDAIDAVGNESLSRFNGEFIEPSTNPNYTEPVEVRIESVGSTSFVFDGVDPYYDDIYASTLIPTSQYVRALKTTTDTNNLAKIIVYDPASPIQDARANAWPWNDYSSLPEFQDDGAQTFPPISTYYYSNSPMSFAPNQNFNPALGAAANNGNLWQYHEIDVPSPSKKTNIAFEFTLQYCCEFSALNLYQKVVMKNGDIGEINSVEFDHFNRTINVKGNLI